MTAIKTGGLACAVLLAILSHVSAQTAYAPAANYTVGSFPCSPVVADVNGDGKPDIICANYGGFGGGGDTLSILTNKGDGTFRLASSPVVGSGPWSVAAGDINGDGKADLVCANIDDDTVSVLTNDGHGGFVIYTNINLATVPNAGGNQPTGVALPYFNADTNLDLLVVMNHDADFVEFTNDGHGNFALYTVYQNGSGNVGLPVLETTADVNGDGQPDLISTPWTGNSVSVSISVPALTVAYTHTNTTVSWPSGWTNWNLQQSLDLKNWSASSGTTDDGTNTTHTVPSPPGKLFFRLSHP